MAEQETGSGSQEPVAGKVYVDGLTPCVPSSAWRGSVSAHLFVAPYTNLLILHEFADKLGLRRSWFQKGKRMPHYDVTPGKWRQAVAAGAVLVARKQMVEVLHQWDRYRSAAKEKT